MKSVTGRRNKNTFSAWQPLIAAPPVHFRDASASPPIPDAVFVRLQSLRNNNKRQSAMFKGSKVRQAGLIVFATTLLLILPNLNRLFG
ncbi:hypothetical protein TRP66_16520 [Pseudomonas sp. JDS28PS106]|uniref:hypothetical protein n=1 Tax=Pseudomonas sp. JDS28PS106 TaxID=2497235 RepID=UPI002FD736FD